MPYPQHSSLVADYPYSSARYRKGLNSTNESSAPIGRSQSPFSPVETYERRTEGNCPFTTMRSFDVSAQRHYRRRNGVAIRPRRPSSNELLSFKEIHEHAALAGPQLVTDKSDNRFRDERVLFRTAGPGHSESVFACAP